MIEALIAAKLHAKPVRRTATSGREFTTAKLLAAVAPGETLFVVAFAASAQSALLALDAGDSVAVSDTVTPKAFADREGVAKASLDMVAANVLTPFQLARKRRDAQPEGQQA